ncbi:MAG: hypothetical protein F4Z28_14820 [Gammaproteobacteria bacterium]|nr:hypothetical protein [Gammaproteobacteria bacterium]
MPLTATGYDVQRWFIRALARDSGNPPGAWPREAHRAGRWPRRRPIRPYLHARASIGYETMTAPIADRLIA